MKITICDICYKNDKKIVKATFRVGWNRGLRIDTCENHKDFCKGKKQSDVANWYYDFDLSKIEIADIKVVELKDKKDVVKLHDTLKEVFRE